MQNIYIKTAFCRKSIFVEHFSLAACEFFKENTRQGEDWPLDAKNIRLVVGILPKLYSTCNDAKVLYILR